MSFRTSLRRFFSWDSRNGDNRYLTGEDVRAADTFRAQVDGRSSGTSASQGAGRFNH